MKYSVAYSSCLALGLFSGVACEQQESNYELSSASFFNFTSESNQSDDRAWIRIPTKALTNDFIKSSGFIRDHIYDDKFAFGYLTRSTLTALPIEIIETIVEIDPTWDRASFDPKTLAVRTPKSDDTIVREGYHNYEALTEELENLQAQYPNLVKVASAGQSVEGRELWYLKISDSVEIDEDEPKTLLIANMHGNETAGRELMIYLARDLLENYGVTDRATRTINHSQVFIMPSMNPDGFEEGQRWNANNVDLNRDFPDFTSDPNDTPDGRAPETKAIMSLHAQHRFNLSVNFHGGAVCFNLPWDTQANTRASERFGDDPLIHNIGREYADMNLTMYNSDFDHGLTYGYEWYQVNGGMQDWASHYRKSVHATVELSNRKYPPASSLYGIWLENKESIYRFLDHGLDGIHLQLKDESGAPVENAIISVSNLNRTLDYSDGIVHRSTLSGESEFTVEIRAAGFETKTIQTRTTKFAGTLDEVLMRRN